MAFFNTQPQIVTKKTTLDTIVDLAPSIFDIFKKDKDKPNIIVNQPTSRATQKDPIQSNTFLTPQIKNLLILVPLLLLSIFGVVKLAQKNKK